MQMDTLVMLLYASKLIQHTEKVNQVFKILSRAIKPNSHIVVAYSGGKDSTALSILFYQWLLERRIENLEITFIHNDTCSEVLDLEYWVKEFLNKISNQIRKEGYNVNIQFVKPPVIDNFYWRLFIRGYPAPSYCFRWCVNLLKIKPTRKVLHHIQETSKKRVLLLTGLRESESSSRTRSLKNRYGACSLSGGRCLAYFFSREKIDNMIKLAPLRDWKDNDVWNFLLIEDDFQIDKLFDLYKCQNTRFGCWHCTLVKHQWCLYSMGSGYLYFEALRILYRTLSDLGLARKRKKWGYSKLGALNLTARAIMLRLLKIAEEFSRIKLYGLDETGIKGGCSLRELLYSVDGDEAMKLIHQTDQNVDPKRVVPIDQLRNPPDKELLKRLINKLDEKSISNSARALITEKVGSDLVKELLDNVKGFRASIDS